MKNIILFLLLILSIYAHSQGPARREIRWLRAIAPGTINTFAGWDGSGNASEITGTQATSRLDVFTSGLKGLVPASGGGTSNFLRADGTWSSISAGASGLDNEIQKNSSGSFSGAGLFSIATGDDIQLSTASSGRMGINGLNANTSFNIQGKSGVFYALTVESSTGTDLLQIGSNGQYVYNSSVTGLGYQSVFRNGSNIQIAGFKADGTFIVGSDSIVGGGTLMVKIRPDKMSANSKGRNLFVSVGTGGNTNNNGGDLYISGGAASGTGAPGNIGMFTTPGSFGGGSQVIFIANASTVPTSDPTGGGILYVEGGALKYRGSSGTVTTIANP